MNTRHSLLSVLLIVLCAGAAPSASDPIPLWPDAIAPGDKGDIGAEYNKTEAENKIRITNVTRPTISIHRPPAEKDTGAAVLVCPGGGYNVLAMDIEGADVVKWLNENGITAVLLKYRVPRRAGIEKHVAPLQDVQRAMGIVRHRAREWSIDPKRIGIIGFSAGGHLSASLSTNFETRTYPTVDDADKESCRPDFAMLIYPFYLTLDEDRAKLAPELKVTGQTPPTFIVMTQDDRVEYAYAYALALKAAKVPAEMHVYATGGHGFGLGKADGGGTVAWPKLATEWLGRNGWLKNK
jgi:acetyl esterase/lipase